MNTKIDLKLSPARSRLRVHNDVIVVEGPRLRPNAWRRFWYWALLGWKWESIEPLEEAVIIAEANAIEVPGGAWPQTKRKPNEHD